MQFFVTAFKVRCLILPHLNPRYLETFRPDGQEHNCYTSMIKYTVKIFLEEITMPNLLN